LSNSETAPLIKYKKDVKTWTIVKLTLLSIESVSNKSLAERALMEVLKNLDKSLVENIILKFPDIKIKCIHFMIFTSLSKSVQGIKKDIRNKYRKKYNLYLIKG
ncbi:gem-associated protein 5 isoform X1, partial [Vespula maculifrons]